MSMAEPTRVAIIGYNTLEEAEQKGIISRSDVLTVHTYFNPGERFDRVIVCIPFGRRDICLELSPSVTYVEWNFRRGASQFSTALRFAIALFPASLRVLGEIERCGAQVIQANGPHIPAVVVLLIKLFRRIPAVCFLEAFWETLLPQQTKPPSVVRLFLPYWYKWVYRAFDRYCGTPSLSPDFYVQRGMSRKRISPWTQHFDLRLLDRVSPEEAPEAMRVLRGPKIAVLGRLHPEKLPLDALEAFITVADTCAGNLIFIGDGVMRSELEARARSAGIPNRVLFTGALSNREAIAATRACGLALAPMQGTALVEMMAAGVAVVAYDHETHRALITDRDNGILVPHRKVEQMACALRELLEDSELAASLGRRARACIEGRYSVEAVRDTLAKVFEDAWHSSGPLPE